ncbi:MAG TPA: hypothetical protein PK861_01465 [Thermomonas sp.]|nr:hypothetical protein [Thermomonas sp.]
MGNRIERMKAGAKRLFRFRSSKSGLILSPEQAAAEDPDTVEREAIKAGSLRGRHIKVNELAGASTIARVLAGEGMQSLIAHTEHSHGFYPLRVGDAAVRTYELAAADRSPLMVEVTVRVLDKETGHVR